MSWILDQLFKKGTAKTKDEKMTSYDTCKTENSTPQKIREGAESEAIRMRMKKSQPDV